MIQETDIIPEYLKNLMTHVFPKAYCSILKIFLNNKKSSIIRRLFYENRFVTDSTKKTELFYSFLN